MEEKQKMIKSIISKIKKCTCGDKENNNKVVCGCFKVTEQDIRDAVNNGADSFKEVQAITKVGTGCGKCTDGVKALVDDLLLKRKN